MSILNGGLPKWDAEGRALEGIEDIGTADDYKVTLNLDLIRYYEQIGEIEKDVAEGKSEVQILDGRGAAGYQKGYISVAKSLSCGNFMNADGTVKAPEKIKEILKKNGIDSEKPIISYCGWGITASYNVAAIKHAGLGSVPLYDRSNAEYERRNV